VIVSLLNSQQIDLDHSGSDRMGVKMKRTTTPFLAHFINLVILEPLCAFASKSEPKQHIFAFQIAPVTAVKLLDSIASSRIR